MIRRAKPVDLAVSAAGMLRCYGDEAESHALALAGRYGRARDREASETWTAIAGIIRQNTPSGSAKQKDAAE